MHIKPRWFMVRRKNVLSAFHSTEFSVCSRDTGHASKTLLNFPSSRKCYLCTLVPPFKCIQLYNKMYLSAAMRAVSLLHH